MQTYLPYLSLTQKIVGVFLNYMDRMVILAVFEINVTKIRALANMQVFLCFNVFVHTNYKQLLFQRTIGGHPSITKCQFGWYDPHPSLPVNLYVTQSKSKTIITRSMLTISLIVFTDKLQGHVHTFYSKWFFITIK